MRPLPFLILFWTIASGSQGFGVSFGVRSWSVDEGLASSRVLDIAQAPDGRLWLATSRGIATFDGIRFENYNHVTTDGLESSEITTLTITPQGTVWYATSSGQIGMYRQDQFVPIDFSLPAKDDYVISLESGPDESVIAASANGVIVGLDKKRQSTVWQPHQWFESQRDRSPGAHVLVDANGETWFGLHNELFRWKDSQANLVLPETTVDTSENVAWIWALARGNSGGIWIAADLKLRRFQDGSWVEHRGDFPWGYEDPISGIAETQDGTLWIASRSGKLRAIAANRELLFLSEEDGFLGHGIQTLFEDTEANLWVGTDGAGLVRVRTELFEVFGVESELGEIAVNSITEDRTHDVWMATSGRGLIHWDGYQFRSVFEADKPVATVVVLDSLGRIWAGTESNGLHVVLPGEEPRRSFRWESPDSLLAETIYTVFEDSRSRVWISSEQGLSWLPLEQIHATPQLLEASMGRVRCISETSDGVLWFGTEGQGVYSLREDQVTQYSRVNGLPDEVVTGMCLDDEGRLWVGTHGGGLAAMIDREFRSVGTHRTLSDGFIAGLVNDGQGALWMATSRGISRVRWNDLLRAIGDPSARIREVNYGAEDGLAHTECSDRFYPNILASKLGRVFFPLKRGIAQVGLADVPNDLDWIPPIEITHVTIDGLAVSAGNGKALEIPPAGQRIEIEFSGIGLSAPEKVVYQYRIGGGEGEWTPIGSQRSVSFLALEPGDYEFEVTAALQSGPWNPQPAGVTFVVEAYWWETRAARWGAGVGVLGIIAVGIWRYFRRRLREAEVARKLEQAVYRERERIAQDMHDDLGARLTQLSFQGEMVRRSVGSDSSSRHPMDKVVEGVRQTAQALDDIVWMTNPKNDRLDRLVSHLAQLAGEMSDSVGWNLRVSLPDSIPAQAVSGRCRHEIVMAVKEVFNNASKHSGCSQIEFEVSVDATKLRIMIQDDGQGFELHAEDNKGNGLTQIRDRIASCGGELDLESKRGIGTRIGMNLSLESIVE